MLDLSSPPPSEVTCICGAKFDLLRDYDRYQALMHIQNCRSWVGVSKTAKEAIAGLVKIGSLK